MPSFLLGKIQAWMGWLRQAEFLRELPTVVPFHMEMSESPALPHSPALGMLVSSIPALLVGVWWDLTALRFAFPW